MALGRPVTIDGLWFMSLHHHDGRFVRGGGRFALSRLDADGGRTIFALEDAADISRTAGPGHRAWAHAVSRGLNEILVHLTSARAPMAPEGSRVEAAPLRFDLLTDDDATMDGAAGHSDLAKIGQAA